MTVGLSICEHMDYQWPFLHIPMITNVDIDEHWQSLCQCSAWNWTQGVRIIEFCLANIISIVSLNGLVKCVSKSFVVYLGSLEPLGVLKLQRDPALSLPSFYLRWTWESIKRFILRFAVQKSTSSLRSHAQETIGYRRYSSIFADICLTSWAVIRNLRILAAIYIHISIKIKNSKLIILIFSHSLTVRYSLGVPSSRASNPLLIRKRLLVEF